MRKKRGQNKEVALLRTLANKKSQPYSLRRLIRDLQEIEKNTIPTVGVTARPQADNMYIWHANLRGPEGTPYEGGVFHLLMRFSSKYPKEPPVIELSTSIPHPCVDGNKIRLDMLDVKRKGIYEGWTSAYSVQSILLQLQSFLFEVPVDHKNNPKAVKDAVKAANELVLNDVGHKGPLSPWPSFNSREVENDLNNYKIKKTESELIYEELFCFHTKLSYTETHLGVGLLITRLPRTGEIRSAEPTLDFVSLKAYIKEHLRTSLDNATFSHWMPLYLGEKEGPNVTNKKQKEESVVYLVHKALSMICRGSTKKFEPKFILEVFPKMMVTLVVSMMEQKEHTSLKAIRMFFCFYRLFVLLLDKHPELYDQVDTALGNFKSDEKYRIKEYSPNLGDMLGRLTISKKFKWSDLIGSYLEEQMDRQVLWMIKDVPELEKMEKDSEMDDDRISASFKTTLIGYHLTLFFSVFMSKVVNREGRTREELFKATDEMHGRLSQAEEEMIQKFCSDIRKVKDYYGYFKMLGVPFPSKKELFEAIKKSIGNSLRKKYHGPEDLLNALPPNNEMIVEYQKIAPVSLDSLVVEGKLIAANDPKWKAGVLSRFSWVNDYVAILNEREALKPAQIAAISDQMTVGSIDFAKCNQGKKTIMSSTLYRLLETTSYEEYNPAMTWMELFLKLELELQMHFFIYNPDFKKYHSVLKLIAPYVTALCIEIGSKKGIKSGYHWLTVLLTYLTKLTALKFYSKGTNGVTVEIIKCLQKGVSNFSKAEGKLLKLEFCNIPYFTDVKLLPALKIVPDLRVIDMNKTRVDRGLASVLNKILTTFKNVQELNLVDCKLTLDSGKEVADGLMRAKQLEILRLGKNPNLSNAITSIAYNLAFSPKIALLDISDIPMTAIGKDAIESLYKLLSISGTLKTLNMNKTMINNNVSLDFLKALGDNKTLTALLMDGSAFNNVATLGAAIALNAKRNGPLEYFSACGSITGSVNINTFIENLWVSDYDEELWYGDPQEANKMNSDQKEKKFNCALKELWLNKDSPNFAVNVTTLKHEKYEKFPKVIKFLCENKKLQLLNLESCALYKNEGELLCMGIRTESYLSSIKILNLSRNSLRKEGAQALATNLSDDKTILEELDISGNGIGVSGAKALAKMLTKNKMLKVLNLFANAADVDGARALKEMLKVNTTLEKLDIGYNRLREKGAMALAEGINHNKSCALKTLGLRYNFISDDGITEFFNMAIFACECKLEHLYIKSNFCTEPNLTELQKKLLDKKIVLHVDVFERLKNVVQEKLERSVWISPVWDTSVETANRIKNFFEDQKVGIVVDVRIRSGQKIPNKPKSNIYAIVEFAHVNSVPRALRLASKKKAVISSNRIKIFKAGSGTPVHVKASKKHH